MNLFLICFPNKYINNEVYNSGTKLLKYANFSEFKVKDYDINSGKNLKWILIIFVQG